MVDDLLKRFRSVKLLVFVGTIVLLVLNVHFAYMSEDALMKLILVVVGYMVAQGIADHGAQGAAKEARRAYKDGREIADIVSDALGNGKRVFRDKPSEDKSSEDEPKELIEG